MDTYEMISELNKEMITKFDNPFHFDDRGIVFECEDGAVINISVDDELDGYIVRYGEYFEKFKDIDNVIEYLSTQGLPTRKNKREFSKFCDEYEQFCKMIILMFEDEYTVCLWGLKYKINDKTIYVGIEPEDYPNMTIRKYGKKNPTKIRSEIKYDAYVYVTSELVKYGLKGRKISSNPNISDNVLFYCKN